MDGEVRRACGLPDKKGKRFKLAFHSLRKNVVRSLDLAGATSDQIAAVVGHERGFTLATYNPAGLPLPLLSEVVEKINHNGLEGVAITAK